MGDGSLIRALVSQLEALGCSPRVGDGHIESCADALYGVWSVPGCLRAPCIEEYVEAVRETLFRWGASEELVARYETALLVEKVRDLPCRMGHGKEEVVAKTDEFEQLSLYFSPLFPQTSAAVLQETEQIVQLEQFGVTEGGGELFPVLSTGPESFRLPEYTRMIHMAAEQCSRFSDYSTRYNAFELIVDNLPPG